MCDAFLWWLPRLPLPQPGSSWLPVSSTRVRRVWSAVGQQWQLSGVNGPVTLTRKVVAPVPNEASHAQVTPQASAGARDGCFWPPQARPGDASLAPVSGGPSGPLEPKSVALRSPRPWTAEGLLGSSVDTLRCARSDAPEQRSPPTREPRATEPRGTALRVRSPSSKRMRLRRRKLRYPGRTGLGGVTVALVGRAELAHHKPRRGLTTERHIGTFWYVTVEISCQVSYPCRVWTARPRLTLTLCQ